MTDLGQFDIDFQNLTGQTPFPWQRALYIRFLQGAFPETCELPTGLGKTSMIAIWLIALAYKPDAIPRRLVYVVNRRTVVDQTTTEVLRIRDRIAGTDWEKRLKALTSLETGQGESPLAVSTLRGALADNREWMADPARPAVIIGTVDMIGSRLLFNGYGVGFRSRPLHAGLLGQDTLLIHDEAHLEPAFQACLEAITQDQHRCNDLRKLRVIALSATTRGREGSSSPHPPFQLTPDETAPASLLPAKATEPIHVVWQRLTARKILHLHEIPDEKKLAERVVERALLFKETQRAILIFVRRVEDVGKIVTQLNNAKQHVRPLTGTQRGYERDQLAESEIFKRFLPDPSGSTISGTVYLACTSAGEVGINITADHMICDATTFDSMAQRFGRVNRFGGNPDSEIHVLHPTVIPPSEHLAAERERTLELLANLNEDASPLAISNLDPEARRRAFAPPPEILPVTDVLLDSWALSSFVHDLPGRPPVEPYLHGKEDNDEAQTQFAWRSEVTLLTGKVSQDELDDLFELVPLKPHELLRLATFGKGRAYDQLQKLANRVPQTPVWIIEPDGSLITTLTASEIVAKRGANYVVPLQSRIVILPPEAGSLTDDGTLDGTIPCDVKRDYDVYGMESENPRGRFTVTEDDDGRWWLNLTSGNRNFPIDGPIELDSTQNLDREINRAFGDLKLPAVRTKLCLDLATDDDQSHPLIRSYLIVQKIPDPTGVTRTPEWPALDRHLDGVRDFARRICESLKLPEDLTLPIELAAAWHDLGKGRAVWQRGAGNARTNAPVSKTVHGRPPEHLNHYRHELGSLMDLHRESEQHTQLASLNDLQRDLVLHLIGAHHGRARPNFPAHEIIDPDSATAPLGPVCDEVPERFARLQQKFGRWGLAYLESVLRAADALDSKRIDASPIGNPLPGEWKPSLSTPFVVPVKPALQPTATIHVDPCNPGQFLACCGLLEFADRQWPGASGWFEANQFHIHAAGNLKQLLDAFASCTLTNTMTSADHARLEELRKKSNERKKDSSLEEEFKRLEQQVRENPLLLQSRLPLRLDWFTDDAAGGSRFKTWAGQQSVLRIAEAMKASLKGEEWRNETCLSHSVSGCGLPFNFDSDLGSQGGAIDVGFSFDPLAGSALTRIETSARPVLELFAFIGLQRFRPSQIKNENRYQYAAWKRPLPVGIAFAAASGALPVADGDCFEFRLLYRTKYLKSFLPAVPLYGASHE